MSEVAAHRVLLSHERIISAAAAAHSRRQIWIGWLIVGFILALLIAEWIAGPLTFLLVQRLPISVMFSFGPYLPALVASVIKILTVGLFVAAFLRANRRKLLNYFNQIGMPLEIEGTYEVLTDGLSLTTARITIKPSWQAVDTVSRVPDGWVIDADLLTFFLPSDSFADVTAERAYLAALTAHLTDQARARSPAACRFADAA